jgi:ParB-like chromosome segregation protein Spo0J
MNHQMVKIPEPKLIEISKVKIHPNNVKEHPDKQIKNLVKLIEWVGFKDPIVIDKDFTCRAGHGRLLAAERLGMTEVPYVMLDGLTKKQMDLFIFMDNQINESPGLNKMYNCY